ncbi:hypothetical protein PFZ55_56935, partial [Streptomyces sp. MS2A]|nr:hypothetical protein [Streptomyces sp. MS2A]
SCRKSSAKRSRKSGPSSFHPNFLFLLQIGQLKDQLFPPSGMTAGGRKAAKGFFLLFSDIIGHHFIAESGMGLFRFLQISPRLLKPLV